MGQIAYEDDTFTNYFQRNTGWQAGDATISVPLPDGRTLWLFGDSHVNQTIDSNGQLPCLFNTRNAMMVQDLNNQFTTLFNQNNLVVIEQEEEAVWYWPSGGSIIENNTIYLFYNKMEKDNNNQTKVKGMAIVEMGLPSLQIKGITDFQYNAEFGMATITKEAEGYHYVYGRLRDTVIFNQPLEFFKPIVARCKIGHIYQQDWEFYGAGNWSTHPQDASALAPETNIEYAVFEKAGNYYLFYQESGLLQCGLGRDLYIYASTQPTGIFGNKQLVYTIDNQYDGVYPVTYNGQVHPQFTNEQNELLCSYNLNKICPNPCALANLPNTYEPDTYRPKFVRIPFAAFALSTGTMQLEKSRNIKVYPNPFLDYLTVENQSQSDLSFYLYDGVSGRTIVTYKITNSTQIINFQGLSKGLYFYKILNQYQTIFSQGKLVKSN